MSGKTVEVGGVVFCHRTGHSETFKVYEVVESGDCRRCSFCGILGRCKKPKGLFGDCKAYKRDDGKSVIFKKINQVKMVKSIQ